jgi:hypothetical protein
MNTDRTIKLIMWSMFFSGLSLGLTIATAIYKFLK